MASADFMKATAARVKGMRVHLDDRMRETYNHPSNPDLDTSKTSENYWIGCNSYDEMIKNWEDRVTQVDKDHPPKRVQKDRVTACFVNLPCPRCLTDEGKSEEFFKQTFEFLQKKLGAENVAGATVHRDEVHQYRDKDGSIRTSCEHAHILIAPYACWKDKSGEREGINAKNFMTRSFLISFNKELNAFVKETFGIDYNTREKPEKMSVEELKERSSVAERIITRAEQIKAEIDCKESDIAARMQAYDRIRDRIQEAEAVTRGIGKGKTEGVYIPAASLADVQAALSVADMRQEIDRVGQEAAVRLQEAKEREEAAQELEKKKESEIQASLGQKIKEKLKKVTILAKFYEFVKEKYPQIVDEFKALFKHDNAQKIK